MRGEQDQIPNCLLQLNRETLDSWFVFLPPSLFLSPVSSHHSLLLQSSSLQSIKLPMFPTGSLWICCTQFFTTFSSLASFPISTSPNSSLPSLPCVAGLWGRRLAVHHQGDNNTHGELQLPCLWLRRPLSDSCAAGEWSVVAHFFPKISEEMLKTFVLVLLCGRQKRRQKNTFLFCCISNKNGTTNYWVVWVREANQKPI